jgi:hypothetical protein
MLKSIDGTKIPPGGVGVWAACKQDYALYGTEIYTSFKTGKKAFFNHIFIGVECPLGALPNAHTMTSCGAEYSRKGMEEIHYMAHNRQTCHLNIKFENGYNISGSPVNFPD